MRTSLVVSLGLGMVAVAASRPAAAADVPLAVLGIEATEGAPDTVAAALTDALRQRVSATGSGHKLVPGRDLVEVKLIFSCPDEAPSCMAEAAKSLGATKLLFGSVKKAAGGSFVITLKLLDAARRQVDAWVAEQITQQQATPAAIRAPVQKWFSTLTGQGSMGAIRVTGDPGTTVTLDGAPVGSIAAEPLMLASVTAGRHALLGSKPGVEPVKIEVSVAPGETAQVTLRVGGSGAAAAPAPPAPAPAAPPPAGPVALSGSAGAGAVGATARPDMTAEARPEEPEAPSSRRGLRIAAWATLGTGLLAIVPGVYSSLQIQAINKDLDEYRRFPCPASPRFGCNSDGVAQTRDLNAKEKEYVRLQQDDGDRFTTFQWVFYGAAGALLVTSGILFYLGYAASDDSQASHDGGLKVSVAPFVGPWGGGMTTGLRF